MTDNKMEYETLKNVTERWPLLMISKALELPFIGNNSLKK